MRYCLLILSGWLFYNVSYSQESIHISCKVNFQSNKVVETYIHKNASDIEFSLDQTQQLHSFSGYYFQGRKKCKIKEKKLDMNADFSNINNPTTNYKYTISKKEPSGQYEYSYQTIRNEVMYLSSFQFDSTKNTLLKIEVPLDYKITFQAPAIIKTSKHVAAASNIYQFEHALEADLEKDGQPTSTLQLLAHPKNQLPNDYFSSWYFQLIERQSNLSAVSKSEIDSIVQSVDSKKEKAQLFYEFVRDHIQYYGIESGIKMVQPENVNKVLINRYGDCKDIALLLYSGLQYLNCTSYFGLMNLVENPADVYYLSSFNHAICVLEIDNRFLFLDATDRVGNFEEISETLLDKKLLMIAKNKTSSTVISPN